MGVFTMPSLGADMEAGTLVEWLVHPGDTVSRGDVVAVVETQKGAIEIECFEDGVVHDLKADLGAQLPVGAPLALILAPGEAAPEAEAALAEVEPADAERVPEHAIAAPAEAPTLSSPTVSSPTVSSPTVPEPATEGPAAAAMARAAPEPGTTAAEPPPTAAAPVPAPAAASRAAPGGRDKVSPAARVRARELGVDLGAVRGTGPAGAILIADVEAAASPDTADTAPPQVRPAASPAPDAASAAPPVRAATPMDEMRRAIAAAMTRAKQTIPHFYLSQTIDVQPALDWLADRNAGRPPADRILLGALFVRAAVGAAGQVQATNGHYVDGAFRPASRVNAGVAVALRGGGLVAPALLDAQEMDVDRTMSGMRDLVTRARAGRLRSSEMTEGTITISSLGESGAETMTGVIFPPQVALVGLGAPQVRPWVVDGRVVPRTVVTLTLSADHRVADGRQATRFIAAFETLIAAPETL